MAESLDRRAMGRDVGPSGTSLSDRGLWPGGAPGRIPGVDEPYGGGTPALEDLVALFEAGSAEELWRVLLMGVGLPSSPNSWDPGLVWRHHHDDGQPGALNTALLLCTDQRWRRATSGLIAAIASTCGMPYRESSPTRGRSGPARAMAESPDFDAWCASMVEPGVGEERSAAETLTREAFLRRWFSAFYQRHGSTARDVVEAAFVLDQLKLAAENVSSVMRDIERAGSRPHQPPEPSPGNDHLRRPKGAKTIHTMIRCRRHN